MNSKSLKWTARGVVVFALGLATTTIAQTPAPAPEHLSGIISDYSSVVSNAGPWEMRGHWSLHLKGNSGKEIGRAHV